MFKSILRSASRTPYEILGISPNSTRPEIKARYNELAKKLHPDLHGGDATKFQELKTAYQKIINNQTTEKLTLEQREKRAQELYRSMQEKTKKPQNKTEPIKTLNPLIRLFVSM